MGLRGLFWLKDLFRKLRKRIAIKVKWITFGFWRIQSRIQYGSTRWISIYEGEKIFVRTDDYRSYRIAQLRGTQKEKISVWRELLQLGPEVCVDIGANYGEFSSSAASIARRVIAIEANPNLINCLRQSFSENPNVTVVHRAISNRNGQTSFYFDDEASGSGSLGREVPLQSQLSTGRVDETTVAVETLSSLLFSLDGKLPTSLVLKIDVEGFEEFVLEGAKDIFNGTQWWRAIVEFNASAMVHAQNNPNRLWDWLRSYPGFIISNKNTPPIESILSSRLPKNYPLECDVVIGQGAPTSFGSALRIGDRIKIN